jgi:hypothetical protein
MERLEICLDAVTGCLGLDGSKPAAVPAANAAPVPTPATQFFQLSWNLDL